MPITYGEITDVLIYIPRGHVGLATLKILYHEHQIYPNNHGGVYRGNETSIPFRDNQEIHTAPFELKAVGTNEDTAYDHTFYVGLAVTRKTTTVKDSLSSSYPDYSDLIGSNLEDS